MLRYVLPFGVFMKDCGKDLINFTLIFGSGLVFKMAVLRHVSELSTGVKVEAHKNWESKKSDGLRRERLLEESGGTEVWPAVGGGGLRSQGQEGGMYSWARQSS